jgi:outer membrane phospholipase A
MTAAVLHPLLRVAALLACALAAPAVRADINLLAPSRVIDPSQPLRLTLLITGEEDSRSYSLPDRLRVTLTPDLGAAASIELQLEKTLPAKIELRLGQFLRIDYVGAVPAQLRGRVRIDAVDMDAPAMVVQLSTPRATAAVPVEPAADNAVAAAAAPPAADGTAASQAVPPPATTLTVLGDNDPNRQDEGRLSFYDPMFFIAGPGIDANAQLQFSFKLRLYEPADKTSRRFVDNLYFGFTQAAFWDLSSESKPFLDTRYMPSLFYYIPNTDWRVAGHAVGIAAGVEHESNGKDGDASRSLDILFVKPSFSFGDMAGFHWTFTPKLYLYLEKEENPDIARYRGYGDLRFTYGKNNDWQLAWMLRKGTQSSAFSSDLQGTYPLNRLAPGLTGYLMAQYFTGYGETLLGYNERTSWSLRFGYAISR